MPTSFTGEECDVDFSHEKNLHDVALRVINIYEIFADHVELLQAVGMLRICNVSNMLQQTTSMKYQAQVRCYKRSMHCSGRAKADF